MKARNITKRNGRRYETFKGFYLTGNVFWGTLTHNQWHDLSRILSLTKGHLFGTCNLILKTFSARLMNATSLHQPAYWEPPKPPVHQTTCAGLGPTSTDRFLRRPHRGHLHHEIHSPYHLDSILNHHYGLLFKCRNVLRRYVYWQLANDRLNLQRNRG